MIFFRTKVEAPSFYMLVGLSLIYGSSYFLPPLCSTDGSYLLPSLHLFSLIGLPTLISMAVFICIGFAAYLVVQASLNTQARCALAILILAIVSLIAIKGIFYAAGYDWRYEFGYGPNAISVLRLVKDGSFLALLIILWNRRGQLHKIARFISSLGFAFGTLAFIRMLMLLWNSSHGVNALEPPSSQMLDPTVSEQAPAPLSTANRSRRVVWLIFDETDFQRLFSSSSTETSFPPRNFLNLASKSVSAINANSPASATLYSIPALLTGSALGGFGVSVNKASAQLSFEKLNGDVISFGEDASIFGRLNMSGRSGSILGFYHPYCRIFKLARCDSFPWPDVGAWDASLIANLPDFIFTSFLNNDYWESITQRTLALLPEYISRDDALTFIHLNIPHLPADYADRKLGLPKTKEPLIEYSRNLIVADQILGEVLEDVEKQSLRHEILLVVSSDHWLRNRWYQPTKQEASKPIPFFVWRVGESRGYVLSNQVSTVHTADMILDYLDGKITTQADISSWWAQRPFLPSYLAPVY